MTPENQTKKKPENQTKKKQNLSYSCDLCVCVWGGCLLFLQFVPPPPPPPPPHTLMSIVLIFFSNASIYFWQPPFLFFLFLASNEFFFDFPNCLAYETLEQCVEHLQYALTNKPMPLSPKHRLALSWEGATERLYQAAGITLTQDEERKRYYWNVIQEEQESAARQHVSLMRKSNFVSNLFSNGKAAVVEAGLPLLKTFSSTSSSLTSLVVGGVPTTDTMTDSEKQPEQDDQQKKKHQEETFNNPDPMSALELSSSKTNKEQTRTLCP